MISSVRTSSIISSVLLCLKPFMCEASINRLTLLTCINNQNQILLTQQFAY